MTEWEALRRGLLAVTGIVVLALVAWWIETGSHDDRGLVLTLRCLVVEKGLSVTRASDPLARSARLGALRTTVETNGVTIAVAAQPEEADRLGSAYRSVGGYLGARLEVRGRNVLLWNREPSPTQRRTLYDCTH